jgi:hypothetical protein
VPLGAHKTNWLQNRQLTRVTPRICRADRLKESELAASRQGEEGTSSEEGRSPQKEGQACVFNQGSRSHFKPRASLFLARFHAHDRLLLVVAPSCHQLLHGLHFLQNFPSPIGATTSNCIHTAQSPHCLGCSPLREYTGLLEITTTAYNTFVDILEVSWGGKSSS